MATATSAVISLEARDQSREFGVLDSKQKTNFEKLLKGASEMMKSVEVTCGGYVLPTARELPWEPELDEDGNVVTEVFILPLDFIEIIPPPADAYAETYTRINHFIVEVLGEEIGFSKVEFPTLDVSYTERDIALVKLYRAKLKVKEING